MIYITIPSSRNPFHKNGPKLWEKKNTKTLQSFYQQTPRRRRRRRMEHGCPSFQLQLPPESPSNMNFPHNHKRLITARFHRPEIPDLGNDDPPSLSGGLSCHKHPPSHPRSIVCWTVGLILRLKTISI